MALEDDNIDKYASLNQSFPQNHQNIFPDASFEPSARHYEPTGNLEDTFYHSKYQGIEGHNMNDIFDDFLRKPADMDPILPESSEQYDQRAVYASISGETKKNKDNSSFEHHDEAATTIVGQKIQTLKSKKSPEGKKAGRTKKSKTKDIEVRAENESKAESSRANDPECKIMLSKELHSYM